MKLFFNFQHSHSYHIVIVAFFFLCCDNPFTDTFFSRQKSWLLHQQTPNSAIPLPDPHKRHLIASYEIDKSDASYAALVNKSFLYDNAVSVIAFCYMNNWEQAHNLLLTLSRLIRKNGSFWFNYNLEVEWPSEQDQEFALIRTGTIAWVGYSYCFFLENCPQKYLTESERRILISTAEKIASFLEITIDRNQKSPLYGLAKGGKAEISYGLNVSKDSLIEIYSQAPVYWVSTEHNIDVHLFFTHLFYVTQNTMYLNRAQLIEKNLIKHLWSEKYNQFYRGLRSKQGTIDSVLALDCASWAAIFLHNTGNDSLAHLCMKTIHNTYANFIDSTQGFLPYQGTTVYENDTINAYFFPDKPHTSWGDFPFFWWEGNFGVALALHKTGSTSTARNLMRQWQLFLSLDTCAGIPYSTKTIPYQFMTLKSVASTAWYIIVMSIIKGKTLPHDFFSE